MNTKHTKRGMEYYFVRFRDFRVHTKKSPLSLTQGHQDDLRHHAGEEGRVCRRVNMKGNGKQAHSSRNFGKAC